MGICSSCEALAVAPAMTAKLVLLDGRLKEFDRPVRASYVLGKEFGSTCFVCDADEMEFDGPVRAVPGDEDLLPGQLYFLLPRSMLRHPLHAEEMAALAARASTALMGAGDKCRCPIVFPEGSGEERRRRRSTTGSRTGSGRKGRGFTADLGAIPE